MTDLDPEILDHVFHGSAFAAFLDQAARQQTWPDIEATKRLAYRYYEEELAAKGDAFQANRPSLAMTANAQERAEASDE